MEYISEADLQNTDSGLNNMTHKERLGIELERVIFLLNCYAEFGIDYKESGEDLLREIVKTGDILINEEDEEKVVDQLLILREWY